MSPAKKSDSKAKKGAKNGKKSSAPASKKTARVKPTTRAPKKAAPPAPAAAARSRVRPVPSPGPSRGGGGETSDTVRMVRELATIVERRALTELIIDTEEMTLTIRRGESAPVPSTTFVTAAPAMAQMAPAPVAAEAAAAPAESAAAPAPAEPADDSHVVTSPFVGTFYRRPNPDAEPYVEVGARVTKGTVLCIVEAMKLMNEIEADTSGVVSAVLVNDAEPVEYGQALFKITPA